MLIIFRTLCGPMREFLVDPDDFWRLLEDLELLLVRFAGQCEFLLGDLGFFGD